MTTRQPRARKEKSNTASALLDALRFISIAQNSHPKSPINQTHCRLTNGRLMAFDGGLTVGILLDEPLSCAPHTDTLIKALEGCTDSISITLLDNGKLSVKSGKLRAVVPCAPLHAISAGFPDDPCATLTDDLKTALAACITVVRDGEPMPACGVLLQSQTAVATNRHMLIEAWHGIDLPPVFLPRVSAKAIADSKKPLKAFGFSDNSATFYFEDDSFIKTQLFDNKFPSYQHFMNVQSNPWPLPSGFYDGVEVISKFAEFVHFKDGKMLSSNEEKDATSYDVEGLKNGFAFRISDLKALQPFISTIHFGVTESISLFFSQDGLVRGAVTRVVPKVFDDLDDDIPF